jgi:transcription termination/antitermination protein NusG
MNSRWFVLHVLSGQEQKVRESLEKRSKAEEMSEYIKEILIPMEKVAEVRNGKKTITSRKLHPGYVYIDCVLLDDDRRLLDRPWYFIRDTPGLIGFVGGEKPIEVEPHEIAAIKSQCLRNREDQRRALPELQRRHRGAGRREGQVEDHRERLRPQHARRT